jgi:hypothetical protein
MGQGMTKLDMLDKSMIIASTNEIDEAESVG